jgi:succinoglycan biosynthesis protein ExoO
VWGAEQVVTAVSVIIPARNAAKWIADAIYSVRAQTLPAHEIIVIDNASSDHTCAVVTRLAKELPQLTLIRNAKDLGPGGGRNIGIDRASGEWMALLDADDWYAPTRLERLIKLATASGDSIVADNQVFARGPGEPTFGTLIAQRGLIERIGIERFLQGDRVVARRSLGVIKPIFRRDFLTRTKVRYDEGIIYGEDSLFYINCLIAGAKILLTDQPLYYYRRHRDSLSRGVTPKSVIELKEKNSTVLAPLRAGADDMLAGLIDQRIGDLEKMVIWRELVAHIRVRHWMNAAHCVMSNRAEARFLLFRLLHALWDRVAESPIFLFLSQTGHAPRIDLSARESPEQRRHR